MSRLLSLAALVVAPAAFAQDADIVDVAAGNEDFETLVAAVQAAELVETLKGEGPFTVFAPTDDAFDALEEGALDSLLLPENKDKLTAVLTYHVVAGQVLAADVTEGEVETVQGDTIEVTVTEDGVMVDGANVTATDIMATNGVIHVIDAVIMPEMEMMEEPEPEPEPTIVSVAAENGNFGTLVQLIEAAGLVEALSGEGPFTVFAPTDDAFAELDEATVADLMKPENKDQLAAVLKYHVVSGAVKSDAISSGKVDTLEGSQIKVKVKNGAVRVNKANVTIADIETTNGVIHVIDGVLMP